MLLEWPMLEILEEAEVSCFLIPDLSRFILGDWSWYDL
jgi:hypothetical protein